MNILKMLACSAMLSIAAASSIAYSADDVAGIKQAIDQTVAKVEETIAALDKGEDKQKVAEMIVEARQLQKSISTSDAKVSMKRSQSNHKLVEARKTILDGDTKAAGELLKEALAGYREVKDKFNAAH